MESTTFENWLDLHGIYNKLKEQYSLELTSALALNAGFGWDQDVLTGESPLGRFYLYFNGVDAVLDYDSECGYSGDHWHPYNNKQAIAYVIHFMEGTIFHLPQSTDAPIAALHQMKLHAAPFAMIKSGEKTIELRLFDEKRQQIREGDLIVFTYTATGEKLTAKVQKLHRFASFEELYQTLPLLQCGYTAEDIHSASPADMEAYYSKEEQQKYGVVGIELSLL